MTAAQRHARASQLAASQALTYRQEALYRSAQAHDRAAEVHRAAAAMAVGDIILHLQMAAFHQDATAADRRLAAQIPHEPGRRG